MNRDEFVQLMEALPMGVFVLDEAGRPHYANGAARKLLGRGIDRDLPPDQLNERYHAYLAGTDRVYPVDRAPIHRALSGESSTVDDMEIHREGRRVPIEVTAAPIFDPNGKVVYAVAVFHEITERREAQDLLRRARDEMEQRVKERTAELESANVELRRAKETAEAADRGKTVFLAGMSHELRTPLNHIIGYSEILEEAVAERGSEDLAADARKIREAAGHLLLVISDILDLAKIETGKVELQIAEFPLEPLLQEVAERARPQAERNGNSFRLELPPEGVGTMTADRAKLRQALVNPLSNACRFTTNGTVSLRVSLEMVAGQEWVVVRVEDTGVGMAPEKVAGLFEGFAHADASAMRRAGGTGLGLAITRRFCQLMGGDASVESRLGEGTTLTLRLPRRVPVKA